MKPILVLTMMALCVTACAPKPAANTATAAAINGANGCAAPGFGPGSPGYQDCVNALAGANPPAADANAAQMRAQIQTQIAQQQAQMQQQMNQAMSNSASGCTTTRDANNNVTTQCP
jgi:hypothetical protein